MGGGSSHLSEAPEKSDGAHEVERLRAVVQRQVEEIFLHTDKIKTQAVALERSDGEIVKLRTQLAEAPDASVFAARAAQLDISTTELVKSKTVHDALKATNEQQAESIKRLEEQLAKLQDDLQKAQAQPKDALDHTQCTARLRHYVDLTQQQAVRIGALEATFKRSQQQVQEDTARTSAPVPDVVLEFEDHAADSSVHVKDSLPLTRLSH